MIALRAEDVRTFTSKLFVKEDFDQFLVKEIEIVTFNRFTIDGHIRQGYFGEEELEERKIEEFSSWKMLRPICFALIKGKKLPGSFRIVLQLSPGAVEKFVKNSDLGITESQIQGLYLNIRYEEGVLYCVTCTSLYVFTLDKALETEWDRTVERFMREHDIVCVR